MTSEDDLKKKAYEYNIYKAQFDKLAEDLSVINQSLNNLQLAKQTLNGVFSSKTEHPQILVPVGGNAFIEAKVEGKGEVLVNVGLGYVIKKTVPSASEFFDERIKELDETWKKLEKEHFNLNERLEKTGLEINELNKTLEKKTSK